MTANVCALSLKRVQILESRSIGICTLSDPLKAAEMEVSIKQSFRLQKLSPFKCHLKFKFFIAKRAQQLTLAIALVVEIEMPP